MLAFIGTSILNDFISIFETRYTPSHNSHAHTHTHTHTQSIISAVEQKLDETTACVMRTILNLSSNQLEDTRTSAANSPEVHMYVHHIT